VVFVSICLAGGVKEMAVNSGGFNLSEVIREYRKAHRGVSAKNALEGIKKAHPSQKINEGTFKATFYKLAGKGKRRGRTAAQARPHDGCQRSIRTGPASWTRLHSLGRER
jgi:hypothetical protein